jgi:hypothetical protein
MSNVGRCNNGTEDCFLESTIGITEYLVRTGRVLKYGCNCLLGWFLDKIRLLLLSCLNEHE